MPKRTPGEKSLQDQIDLSQKREKKRFTTTAQILDHLTEKLHEVGEEGQVCTAFVWDKRYNMVRQISRYISDGIVFGRFNLSLEQKRPKSTGHITSKLIQQVELYNSGAFAPASDFDLIDPDNKLRVSFVGFPVCPVSSAIIFPKLKP